MSGPLALDGASGNLTFSTGTEVFNCHSADCASVTGYKYAGKTTDSSLSAFGDNISPSIDLNHVAFTYHAGPDSTGIRVKSTSAFTFKAYDGSNPDKDLFRVVSPDAKHLLVVDGHGNMTLTGDLTVLGEIRSDTPCNVSVTRNVEFYPILMLLVVGFFWQRKQIKALSLNQRVNDSTLRAAP